MKIAYITGATKGIGRSTAIAFANAGWDLILLSRNLDILKNLKVELSKTKVKINPVVQQNQLLLVAHLLHATQR